MKQLGTILSLAAMPMLASAQVSYSNTWKQYYSRIAERASEFPPVKFFRTVTLTWITDRTVLIDRDIGHIADRGDSGGDRSAVAVSAKRKLRQRVSDSRRPTRRCGSRVAADVAHSPPRARVDDRTAVR
jgi:hypothetical protein